MSSDVIARVLALTKKADELSDKGHLLRAAENYGRAAETARALGTDNLVSADMQLRQGEMFCMWFTHAPDATADPRKHAAHRTECITLFSNKTTYSQTTKQHTPCTLGLLGRAGGIRRFHARCLEGLESACMPVYVCSRVF